MGINMDERPEVDLHSIRIVRAIKETGSITGASRLLGQSQPAVSQHLQRAESRLGMPLIVRIGRSVRLSEAGEIVARAAPAVLEALDAAGQELAGLAALRAGKVRLASFPTASATLVPAVISALRRTSPGVVVSYTETEPREATRLVLDGEADVALVASYPGDPVDEVWLAARGVSAIPRFVDEMVLVLPAEHPLAGESVVDLAALEEEEWVAACPRCRHHLVSACQHEGFEPRISFETDNFAAVVGMVATGLGVAILPRLSLSTAALPPGAVVRRTNPQGAREIHVVVPQDLLGSQAVSAAVATLDRMDGSPWHLAASPRRAAAV